MPIRDRKKLQKDGFVGLEVDDLGDLDDGPLEWPPIEPDPTAAAFLEYEESLDVDAILEAFRLTPLELGFLDVVKVK